jgi:2-amino-4-hydroxy-6-hydroxymethyldihydropteridine diphosphokinase
VKAFISVGSNIEPEDNVKRAIRLLVSKVRVTGVSTVYLTPPIDRPDQDWYYNCVIKIETDYSPGDLRYKVLRPIEDALGRVRTADKYESRPIDLDLIIYDDLVLQSEEITLPDPLILKRPFLAEGIYELTPDLEIPGANLTVFQLVTSFGKVQMIPLRGYSDIIKGEISHATGLPENRKTG